MRALLCDHTTVRFDPAYRDPQPPAGEALVRLRLAGICNTDLELIRGYMGYQGVLGHEFVGEIIQLPAYEGEWPWRSGLQVPGARVVGDINAACYACPTCLSGNHTHCPHRTTLGIVGRDGVFADTFCLPMANLYPVPESVPDETAVFVEPLAAACEILEQVAVKQTDDVVVLGAGKLGLLVAAVLRLAGCHLTLVGRNKQSLGIGRAWDLECQDAADPFVARSADLVVECTGRQEGFERARSWVKPRGTIVVKSTYEGKAQIDMSALVVDEITVVGSRCGPFEPALRLLDRGLVDPRPLIAACYSLSDGAAAFAHAAIPGTLKVLLRP